MNKLQKTSLDYYNKSVIQRIVDKYAMTEMDAAREFLQSKTHAMLENADLAMWEFAERFIFEIWEVEKITGDPRNSEHFWSFPESIRISPP